MRARRSERERETEKERMREEWLFFFHGEKEREREKRARTNEGVVSNEQSVFFKSIDSSRRKTMTLSWVSVDLPLLLCCSVDLLVHLMYQSSSDLSSVRFTLSVSRLDGHMISNDRDALDFCLIWSSILIASLHFVVLSVKSSDQRIKVSSDECTYNRCWMHFHFAHQLIRTTTMRMKMMMMRVAGDLPSLLVISACQTTSPAKDQREENDAHNDVSSPSRVGTCISRKLKSSTLNESKRREEKRSTLE